MNLYHKWKEKQEQKRLSAELDANGIALGNITPSNSRFISSRLTICLLRSVLIFMASFGTVGCMVSSFSLPYYPLLVALILFVISLYISFLYYNRAFFYIGYIGFFIGFTISIFSFYWYINSGYQAFMNTVYEKYSDYFLLTSYREATEYITDRYATVSVTMIFVGAFLSLLLNITISGYMSLTETFLITFPLLQVGLYIDCRPHPFYLILLLGAYITVGILGRSGHYRLPTIKNNGQTFFTLRKKNRFYHSYISSGPGMLSNTIYSIVFCTLFMILCTGIFYSDMGSKTVSNRLKNTTDEYVKTFIQTGLFGFFDRYDSTGGLSRGQLGGVGSVRPDYETDLIVTFVPLDSSAIYLKGYIGTTYTGNFFAPVGDTTGHGIEPSSTYSMTDFLPAVTPQARMLIENVGADSGFDYLPYYSYAKDYNRGYYTTFEELTFPSADGNDILAFSATAETETDIINVLQYEAHYIPTTYSPALSFNAPSQEYKADVYNNNLQIPTELLPTLSDFCAESDLLQYQISDSSDTTGTLTNTLSAITALKQYYVQNFYYTMSPGTTPRNRDVVDYFLTEQKRGYCAHFASSATMIFRYLGIPARYVEGYCIQLSDIMDGVAVSTDINGWVYPAEDYASEGTGVVQVEVTDASAHAWVEVYVEGYGWLPVEVTPPSSDTMVTDFNLAGLFSGLFQTADTTTLMQTPDNFNPADYEYKFRLSSLDFLLRPLITILLSVLFAVISVLCIKHFLTIHKLAKLEKQANYSAALLLQSQRLRRIVAHKPFLFEENTTNREFFRLLGDLLPEKKEIMRALEEQCNRAAFSDCAVSKEEYEKSSLHIKECESCLNMLKKERKKK